MQRPPVANPKEISMKKIATLVLACGLVSAATALAADTKSAAPTATPAAAVATAAPAMMAMKPAVAGEETKKLAGLAGSWTSTGTEKADPMMGLGDATTKGKTKCAWTIDNLWLACDTTDNAVDKAGK